jgi:hypothetical protein
MCVTDAVATCLHSCLLSHIPVLGLPAVPRLRPLNVVSSLPTDALDIRPHGPQVLGDKHIKFLIFRCVPV